MNKTFPTVNFDIVYIEQTNSNTFVTPVYGLKVFIS